MVSLETEKGQRNEAMLGKEGRGKGMNNNFDSDALMAVYGLGNSTGLQKSSQNVENSGPFSNKEASHPTTVC